MAKARMNPEVLSHVVVHAKGPCIGLQDCCGAMSNLGPGSSLAGDPLLERRVGTLCWFSVERRSGFIVDDESREELFVSQLSIKRSYLPQARHNLYVNNHVEYTLMNAAKGHFNTRVTLLSKKLVPQTALQICQEDLVVPSLMRCLQEAEDSVLQFEPRPSSPPEVLIPGLLEPLMMNLSAIVGPILVHLPVVVNYHGGPGDCHQSNRPCTKLHITNSCPLRPSSLARSLLTTRDHKSPAASARAMSRGQEKSLMEFSSSGSNEKYHYLI